MDEECASKCTEESPTTKSKHGVVLGMAQERATPDGKDLRLVLALREVFDVVRMNNMRL